MKKIILFTTFAFVLNLNIDAQKVSTFTGGTPDDGIALDAQGNIYCANYEGDAVFKFTPTGEVSTFASGMESPNGIAFNSTGELYVCDGQDNKVYRYANDGSTLSSYSSQNHPSGIIKDFDSETMIFTEFSGNNINTLTPDGVINVLSNDTLLNGPVGLAFDENEQLFVGNYLDRKIYKVSSDGSLTYVATVGSSSFLGFIAFGRGMIWGTVLEENKIYQINPNAVDDVEVFAGSTAGSNDGDLPQATFNQPNGIFFNSTGDTLYITDFGSKNLRIIDMETISNNADIEKYKFDCSVFPNPVEDQLNISLLNHTNENIDIEIIDASGKKLYATSYSSQLVVDIRTWKSGTYFVRFSSEGYSETRKVVKQ